MNTLRVALAVVLGVSAYGVGVLSDGMLGAARSPTPPATFVIIGAYLALCQFLVAVKGAGLRASLPTMLGMTAPWVLLFAVHVASENRETILGQGIPLLLAGSLGPLVGAIVAGAWGGKRTSG